FRFATKAALLRHLAEETFAAMSQESEAFFLDDATRKLSMGPFLDAFIELVAGIYSERRNLLRAFLQEARPGGDKIIVALVRAGSAESVRMLVGALFDRKKEIRHTAPDVAIPMVTLVLGVT